MPEKFRTFEEWETVHLEDQIFLKIGDNDGDVALVPLQVVLETARATPEQLFGKEMAAKLEPNPQFVLFSPLKQDVIRNLLQAAWDHIDMDDEQFPGRTEFRE